MTPRLKCLIPFAVAATVVFFKWRLQCLLILRLLTGAAIIAFLLGPLCSFLTEKMKWTRSSAILAAYCTLIAAVAALFLFLTPAIISQIRELLTAVPRLIDKLYLWLQQVSSQMTESGVKLPDISEGMALLPDVSVLDGTTALASSLASGAGEFVLMLTLGFYFIRDKERLLLRLEMLVPAKYRRLVLKTMSAIRLEMGTYIRCQALISLLVGIMAALAMAICGLRAWLALGLIVGLFNLIPYFGPVIGAIPAVLMALGSGLRTTMFTILALILVQQIDNMIVSPRIMSSACGLHPALVLLAIAVGSSLNGLAGMLFSVPVLLIFRSIARNWPLSCENV